MPLSPATGFAHQPCDRRGATPTGPSSHEHQASHLRQESRPTPWSTRGRALRRTPVSDDNLRTTLCQPMKPHTLALVSLLALVGCAAVGPAFAPATNVATGTGVIYVYRPQAHAMSMMTAVFEVDGRTFASIENNGFAALSLPAGKYTVVHRWKAGLVGNSNLEGRPVSISVSVAPGKSTYVRLLAQANTVAATASTTNSGFNMQFRWLLQEVSETAALPEIQQTRGRVADLPP